MYSACSLDNSVIFAPTPDSDPGLNDGTDGAIVNIVATGDLVATGGAGTGDVVQSFFFSPSMPLDTGFGNLTWGVGPAIAIPTGTDDLLGSGKLGLGPTGVALIQSGPWTYGALANHIWSVAGENDRDDVSATFI